MYANGVNTIALTCRTDSSNPPSSITWYIDGLLVTTNNTTLTEGDFRGQVTSQQLEIVPSREMDDQIVECRASNEVSPDTVASSSLSLSLRCNYFL